MLKVRPLSRLHVAFRRFCHTTGTRAQLYERCYRILGVDETADQNTIRRKYIELVKKVHPDSGHPDASADAFHDIDLAFKTLQAKFAKARRGILEDPNSEVKIFDIRHTAPQHRQFLSYEGYGSGTIFQRERQFQQRKVVKAQERVMEHRLQKAQASETALMKKGDYYRKHAIKTKYGYDRVVEDLIQEAMSRGDFQNIKGSGKPLDNAQSQNPYVDFITFKMNKILMDNGFVPEWISLHKEIRESIADLRESLVSARKRLGDLPLSDRDEKLWSEEVESHRSLEASINKKIDKFNLIVPVLEKQMMRIQLERVCDRILKEVKVEPLKDKDRKGVTQRPADTGSRSEGVLGLLDNLFSR